MKKNRGVVEFATQISHETIKFTVYPAVTIFMNIAFNFTWLRRLSVQFVNWISMEVIMIWCQVEVAQVEDQDQDLVKGFLNCNEVDQNLVGI